jgi:hypothetical protein
VFIRPLAGSEPVAWRAPTGTSGRRLMKRLVQSFINSASSSTYAAVGNYRLKQEGAWLFLSGSKNYSIFGLFNVLLIF